MKASERKLVVEILVCKQPSCAKRAVSVNGIALGSCGGPYSTAAVFHASQSDMARMDPSIQFVADGCREAHETTEKMVKAAADVCRSIQEELGSWEAVALMPADLAALEMARVYRAMERARVAAQPAADGKLEE